MKYYLVPILLSIFISWAVSVEIISSQPVPYTQTTGFGSSATYASSSFMSSTNNLAEVAAAGPTGQAASRTNLGLSAMSTSTPTVNTGVSRSIVTSTSATGFQVSSTGLAWVSYSITTSTTATIGGASSGLVYLEICATNSTTPANWIVVNCSGNSQTISVALALQSVQTTTGIIDAMIPAGYYVRLRSSNVSGTPTFTYNCGTETLF